MRLFRAIGACGRSAVGMCRTGKVRKLRDFSPLKVHSLRVKLLVG
jgi:hypothetical protein